MKIEKRNRKKKLIVYLWILHAGQVLSVTLDKTGKKSFGLSIVRGEVIWMWISSEMKIWKIFFDKIGQRWFEFEGNFY